MLWTRMFAFVQFCFVSTMYIVNGNKCGFYKLDHKTNIHKEKRLVNHGYLNATIGHHVLCFNKCVENCLCESFNVCGTRCELSSSTKQSSPEDYKNEMECTYYDIGQFQRSEISNSQCHGSAQQFCCSYHNPCLNGGVCIGFCPDLGKRFECECKPGYYGDRCQAHTPSTCQDYFVVPKPANGMYSVFDENNVNTKVFCDFLSEEGMAWTLFLSRDSNQGDMGPLWKDFSAINNNLADINWSGYRLPKATVIYFMEKSTHWRLTCEFDKLGVDYVDYIRIKINETNPVTYNHNSFSGSDKCRMGEYVNIRGRHCQDCTVFIGQGSSCLVHSGAPRDFGCDFDNSNFVSDCPNPLSTTEFYFNCRGSGCVTGKHRCTATATSTTQIWIAG